MSAKKLEKLQSFAKDLADIERPSIKALHLAAQHAVNDVQRRISLVENCNKHVDPIQRIEITDELVSDYLTKAINDQIAILNTIKNRTSTPT